ncbi:MAG TPA: TSUP family transporter, partial [Phycisphaerae bacterium]
NILNPLIIALLSAVALFMIFYRVPSNRPPPDRPLLWLAVPIAFLSAAYDGFFGPGTGTFLILAYALIFHDPLDAASANAKLVNFCSNLAAMVLFAAQGWILWPFALPMAAGQIAGALIGSHITLRKGKPIVRITSVCVCLALIIKVAWDFQHS